MPKVEGKNTRPKRGFNARERESRMHRFVFLAGTIVIVSVVSLIGTGYYFTQYVPLHQVAFKVNDKEFDMSYYASAYRFYGTGQEVVELLEQSELIRQAAEKLGITVTDDEAKVEVEKRKLPVTSTFTTFIKAELLTNKLLAEYFDDKVPNSTLQRESMAMFLESQKQANDIKNRLANGEDFGKLAAQYSLDPTTKGASGYLDWHPYGSITALVNSPVLDDYVFNATIGVVSDPVADTTKTKTLGYWIAKLAGRQEDQIHLLAILAPDQETANSTLARLQAGEDFATVAKEVSQFPSAQNDGGDFGYITNGYHAGIFDNFAFNPLTKDGDLSQVIPDSQSQTKGGYWLVKVLTEDKDKIMSQQDHTAQRTVMYNDWVESLWSDPNNKVESFLTDEMKQRAVDMSNQIQ